MKRDADAEVIFKLISTLMGGRKTAAHSGYRPCYEIKSDYLTTVHHQFIEQVEIKPGSEAKANIWFVTPELYPQCLWLGREISVYEGSILIGHATVTSIFNPILNGVSSKE